MKYLFQSVYNTTPIPSDKDIPCDIYGDMQATEKCFMVLEEDKDGRATKVAEMYVCGKALKEISEIQRKIDFGSRQDVSESIEKAFDLRKKMGKKI